jgi:CelD/BcsL family acetyltransferase involved in cellulose biosynthesis
MSAQALRVDTISEIAGFTALREEWNELLAASRADSLFLTWEWLHTWWLHARGDARLALLAVRRGEELVGLAPLLSRTELFGGARLEFLGTGRVGSDYLDVIARRDVEPEVVAVLASHLARSGSVLDLRQVRLTASVVKGLVRELRRSGCSIRAARTHRCPYIALEGRSWDAFLGSLGSEHRYAFRRKLRKLRAQHELSFELVASEAERRALVPVLFELHRLRWKGRGSDGLQGLEAFHEGISRLALERGWLRLFVLRLDGEPAAALYGFRYGRVFSFYQSGFDPRLRDSSVGSVTLGLAIQSALEDGAAEFDLLHGEEPYKFHWASRSRRLARLTLFPGGPRARLSLGMANAVGAARSVLRRLPDGLAARSVLRMLPDGLAARIASVRRGGRSDAAPAG